MSDNINIDWGSQQLPDTANAFTKGWGAGHQMMLAKQEDAARQNALAAPSDPNALGAYGAFNPMGAQAMQSAQAFGNNQQDFARAAQARQAAGVAVANPTAGNMASVAGLDPNMAQNLQQTIGAMSSEKRLQQSDSMGFLATKAQSLLNVPVQNRAAALQAMAPDLAQHGISQQQIQQYTQSGLGDQQLQGFIRDAVGAKGMMDQQNDRDRIAIQQGTLAETIRQNKQEATKGVADGNGNFVNPYSGKPIYTAGGGIGGAFSNDAPKYADALKATGLSDNAVAGIMGNLHIESGFNSNAVGDNGLASGVAQWHPDRQAAFQKAFGVPVSQGSPQQVAQFIKTEIDQLPSAQRAAINNASSPGSAAAAFDQFYERSDGSKRDQRAQAATNWATSGGTGAAGGGGMSGATIHDQAQAALDAGSLVPLPGMARSKGANPAIASEIARIKQARGLSDGDILAGKGALHADSGSLATLEKQGTIVRSAEIAAQKNGDLALSLAPAVGNGNIQVFNAWKNHWNTATGDPNVAKFAGALATFSNEYATVMGRGMATDSLRKEAHDLINAAQSPDALKGVVATMRQDMANRRAGYDQERQDTLTKIRGGYLPGGAQSPTGSANNSPAASSGWGQAQKVG